MSSEIQYKIGDATDPQLPESSSLPANLIIAHICNDVGGWGKGFVLALSRRYPDAEKAYRQWYKLKVNPLPTPTTPKKEAEAEEPFELGQVQFVPVRQSETSQIWVVNMLAQHGIANAKSKAKPIRYEALAKCLATVAKVSLELPNSSLHMPRIGTGLAGGDWAEVTTLISREVLSHNISVTIYDLA